MKRLLLLLVLFVGCSENIANLRVTLELLQEESTQLKADIDALERDIRFAKEGKYHQWVIDAAKKARLPGLPAEDSLKIKMEKYTANEAKIADLKRRILEAAE